MSNKSFITALIMLLFAVSCISIISIRPFPVVVKTNLENLPMMIGEYTATEDSFPDSVYRELNADKNIYRHYRDNKGNQIDLYIGYYGTAKGGRTGHNPYACLPGEGSAIVDTGVVLIKQSSTVRTIPVNYILSGKDGVNTVMLHWYQTAGKTVVSTGFKQNIERFVGRMLHNRNDGAFIRITTSSSDEDFHKARQRIEQFAVIVLNDLPKYWPEER